MEESKYEMYYPQTSISNPAELGRLPVNWRRRKERDKVSEVWKTFYVSPVEPNAVVCRLCFITLSYVGGSTSGMRNHLQNKHRHIIPKAFSSTTSPSNADSSNRRSREQVINPPSSSRLSSENLPVPPLSSPLPIQVNHSSPNCFPASSQNNSSSSPTCLSPPSPYTERNGENNPGLVSSRRAREVAVMCASDLISPSVVSGKGFHRMFRLLSGDSQALDLTSISAQSVRSAMKDLQFSLRLKIQRQMSSSTRIPNGDYKKDIPPKRRPVSLILCPWTYINPPSDNEFWDFDCNSPAIQSTRFLDVRAQFLGDDWQPESRLLGTLPLPVTHSEMVTQELESSAEKLTVALRQLISTTYELTDSQIVACVFPKCPVLDACVASLKWSPVPCVAHMLDNVVERAFDSTPFAIPSTNHEAKHGASALRTKFCGIGDILGIGLELWKIQKKPKSGKFGNGDPCHDVDLSDGVEGLLENAHKLNDDELKSSLYRQKRGRWRVWCHLLEQFLALTEMEVKDFRFSDWRRNLLSLMPTITRLETAWEALSCGNSGANDDIPLLSCALPILCSLPFCPSLEDSGNGDNVEETSAADKLVPGSDEHPVSRPSRSSESQKDDCLPSECVGSALRHKLKVSLDIAVNIARSEELKGSALLMALAAFVDPRHKALLFLSAAQREEVQQEALRLMSAEECMEKSEAKSVRESPKTGEKRSSSIGSSPYQKRSKLEDLLHGVFGYSTALDFTDISHEIEHYIGEPIAPLSQIPSVWWRQRESKYPRLSQMARRLLTIPASVSTGRRGMSTLHLSPQDITVVLFLHSNLTPSDLEEMGFEVDDEGWRKHDRAEEDEGERDDGMDLREESNRVEDYDETARVVDDDHFYEIESEIHVIKKEPELMNE